MQDEMSFLQEMGDVTPLSLDDTVSLHDPKRSIQTKQARAETLINQQVKQFNPLVTEGVKPVLPDDFLAYQKPGIQEGVFKNLRLGKYDIEHTITLKGLTVEESRQLLYRELSRCHERGVRTVLIRHGKGENSKPFPGLKKSYVKYWLDQLETVIAYHSAIASHGGLGATYALLKKHPNQKLINREKNRRG